MVVTRGGWRLLINAGTVVTVCVTVTGCRPQSNMPRPSEYALTEVAVGVGDSVEIGRPDFARAGPHGLVYVATQRLSGLAMVLDSNAHFLHTIGRRGPGPGEFQSVSFIYPKADSIVLGDARGSVALFGGDGSYVRSLPPTITSTSAVLSLRGDTLLVPEPASSADRFGLPLQLIAPNGDTAKSFGSDDRSFDRRIMSTIYRKVAQATDSTIWVARLDRYQIERWHMNGTLMQTITNQRPWFPSLAKDWDGTNAEPYPTVIKQVHQDRDGHLLVLIQRARADFVPTGGVPSSKESGKTEALVDRLRYLEQVIEVLDARTGALQGSILIRDTYLLNFLDDDRMIGIRATAEGSEVPVLFRVVHPPTVQ